MSLEAAYNHPDRGVIPARMAGFRPIRKKEPPRPCQNGAVVRCPGAAPGRRSKEANPPAWLTAYNVPVSGPPRGPHPERSEGSHSSLLTDSLITFSAASISFRFVRSVPTPMFLCSVDVSTPMASATLVFVMP